jgi:nitrate reductase gamma subunit
MKEYCSVFGINVVNLNYNYNVNTYKIFKDIYTLTVLYVKEILKFNKNLVNLSNVVALYTLHIVLEFTHFLCNPYFLNHDDGHRTETCCQMSENVG